MTRPPLKNVGASVRARLTDYARQRDENAQLVMLRFAIERLIYRLAQSGYRDHFILKGAMLFSLWAPAPYRCTASGNTRKIAERWSNKLVQSRAPIALNALEKPC